MSDMSHTQNADEAVLLVRNMLSFANRKKLHKFMMNINSLSPQTQEALLDELVKYHINGMYLFKRYFKQILELTSRMYTQKNAQTLSQNILRCMRNEPYLSCNDIRKLPGPLQCELAQSPDGSGLTWDFWQNREGKIKLLKAAGFKQSLNNPYEFIGYYVPPLNFKHRYCHTTRCDFTPKLKGSGFLIYSVSPADAISVLFDIKNVVLVPDWDDLPHQVRAVRASQMREQLISSDFENNLLHAVQNQDLTTFLSDVDMRENLRHVLDNVVCQSKRFPWLDPSQLEFPRSKQTCKFISCIRDMLTMLDSVTGCVHKKETIIRLIFAIIVENGDYFESKSASASEFLCTIMKKLRELQEDPLAPWARALRVKFVEKYGEIPIQFPRLCVRP